MESMAMDVFRQIDLEDKIDALKQVADAQKRSH